MMSFRGLENALHSELIMSCLHLSAVGLQHVAFPLLHLWIVDFLLVSSFSSLDK